MEQAVLHLASSSPRRRDILRSLGIAHSFAGVDIDETASLGEGARELVARLALSKAEAAADRYADVPILAADTVVVVGERIFGKPTSEDDARLMLTALSGATHHVQTAVALRHEDYCQAVVCVTEVRFRDIHPDEIRSYWQSGEPAGKAGAYAIQGCGGIFVEQVRGSYSGVVGLPVFETANLLQRIGIRVLPDVTKA